MSVDCDPRALAQAASCLQSCVNQGMSEAIKIYLLATIAGVSTDPDSLIKAASCIQGCIPAGAMPGVQASLLCQIANAGGGGGSEIETEPSSESAYEHLGLFGYQQAAQLPGITGVVINTATNDQGYDIEFAPDLETISFPHLASIDENAYFLLSDNPALVSVSLPVLTQAGQLRISDNDSLTAVDLSNFTTSLLGSNFSISSNASLVVLSLPVYVPINGMDVRFASNALSAASVNGLLAMAVAAAGFVSGILDLTGGTNAAPTGQGIVDKGILNGRGVTCTTN